MLLVSAVNVGECLRIGPTSADCGATAVHASSEGACCSVGLGLAVLNCRAVLCCEAGLQAECVSESEVYRWSAACWSPIRPVLKHGPRS